MVLKADVATTEAFKVVSGQPRPAKVSIAGRDVKVRATERSRIIVATPSPGLDGEPGFDPNTGNLVGMYAGNGVVIDVAGIQAALHHKGC